MTNYIQNEAYTFFQYKAIWRHCFELRNAHSEITDINIIANRIRIYDNL